MLKVFRMTPALLVGALLLFGGAYAWWHFIEYRFTVVTPHQVYRSAAMPPRTLQRVVKRHGIRTVIDLRTPGEGQDRIDAERAALEEIGVTHLNLQSPQVPTEDLLRDYVTYMETDAHRPVLIHCNHGEGRAVLYGALWRIEFEGCDPERARKGCRVVTTRGSSFDVGKAKGDFLRGYERLRTAAP